MAASAAVGAEAAEKGGVDFAEQVAPLLVRRCVECHNGSELKGELDLTRREGALRGGDSGAAIVPGKPAESVLLERVSDGSMPPEGHGEPLTAEHVALVEAWIRQGAVWPEKRILSPFDLTTEHRAGRDWWSLQPVVRPPLPVASAFSKHRNWPRGAIDCFVLAKLVSQDLAPSDEADRVTWLRRVSFDLLGLPPSPREIDSFLADKSPDAYTRQVDRLLASPHYGERWGRHWLDVVGYTESDGFENDKFRPHAWRYRDWVIDSLNADKPYARFITEQLAGDVLPEVSQESIAATGFLVCGAWDEIQNVGASESEMRRAHEEQIAELIGTVSQSFLGITVGCARCHDHKFDPVPQSDFYRFKAVFDGVDHSRGRTVGNLPILTPDELATREARLAPLVEQKHAIEQQLAQLENTHPGEAVVEKLDRKAAAASRDLGPLADGRFASALDARAARAKTKSKPAYHKPPLTVECWVQMHSKSGFNVFVANNKKGSGEHWELYSYTRQGDFSVYLPGYAPSEIRSGVEVTDGVWHYLAMQFDGEQVRLFVDGKQVKEQAVKRTKPAGSLDELVLGGYADQNIGCDGLVDEVRISNTLRPIDGVPTAPFEADEQTVGLWRFDEVRDQHIADVSSPRVESDRQQLAVKRAELQQALKQVESRIAADPLPLGYIGYRRQPEPTYVLLRGDLKSPGDAVTAGALSNIRGPSANFGLEQQTPEGQRRLEFAQWAAHPDNPLTSRVMVNRLWQYHFGQGLVQTPSDFGFNGGLPSHPELLDWLADEFVRSGGSLKQMHRLMVLSATYRQSSQFDAQAARVDADNRLLWRFAPRRLAGETARDAMLAVSGELNRQLGGPSFKPFTVTVFNTHFYHLFDDERPDFNRRTVYRASVITGRDPLLDSLDCPAPAVSTPRRASTVTPQQALSLMNDTFVMRQAERLALRVQGEVGDEINAQLRRAWRLTLAREPTAVELFTTAPLVRENGLAAACWVLLNCSEFLYVE